MSTQYKDYYGTHMPFGQFPKFGVLSSVKVLMTGTNIAGPFAASIMAEMGAQVIQVEAPNMPCQTRGNYGYSQDHRNTYSITLNTRTAKGREVLEKLIAWADIWIESGRPGTYAKNGLSDEHMWKINRKLAIVHVSGYGQTGPDRNKAAYDVSGQAMGGYMYMNGTSPTSPPLKVNPYLSDYATAYNACICALSIMTNARITGEGDACDVSQYETMFRLLGSYPAEWFNKGYPGPGEPVKYRTGNVSDMAAGFSFYDCKDGGTIPARRSADAGRRHRPRLPRGHDRLAQVPAARSAHRGRHHEILRRAHGRRGRGHHEPSRHPEPEGLRSGGHRKERAVRRP